MTPEDTFVEALTRRPDDRTTVAVYADWLMEFRGLTRWHAVRYAARVARAATNALQISEAVALLVKPSSLREAIRERIAESLRLPLESTVSIRLLAGGARPRAEVRNPDLVFHGEPFQTIWVGARWVIAIANSVRFELSTRPSQTGGQSVCDSTSRPGNVSGRIPFRVVS